MATTYTPEQTQLFKDLHAGLQGFIGSGQEQKAKDIYNEKQGTYKFSDEDYLAQTGAAYNANGTSRPYTAAELALWKGGTQPAVQPAVTPTPTPVVTTTTPIAAVPEQPTTAQTAAAAPAPVDYMAQVDAILGKAKADNPAPAALAPAQTYTAAQTTVDPTKTTQGLLEAMLAQDSPYLARARNLAMEGMAERGLLSSSLAQGAGVNAAIDAAGNIAAKDADIYSATARENTGYTNRASEFGAGAQNDFTKTQFGADNERANLGMTSAVNLGNTALSGRIQSDQITQKSQLGLGEMKYGAELDAWKMGISAGFDTDKMNHQQKLDFERMDKTQLLNLQTMAVKQGYDWANMSEQFKLDIAKMVKGGDIQAMRDAFLTKAQDELERYKTDSNNAQSQYNTDANVRSRTDSDRASLAQGIIADKELSADRKATLLRGMGFDALADSIMVPSAETLDAYSRTFESDKANPDSAYNKSPSAREAADRRANAAITNILTSTFLTQAQKKTMLLRYGQKAMADSLGVFADVATDLGTAPATSTGLIGNYLGGEGAGNSNSGAESNNEGAGGFSGGISV